MSARPIDAVLDEATSRLPAGSPWRGWWRRNVVAILVFLLLAAVTIGVVAVNGWLGYYQNQASIAVPVAGGETVEYGGATWRIDRLERVGRDDPEVDTDSLPAGTEVVFATVEVDPGDAPPYCEVSLIERMPGHPDRTRRADLAGLWADYDGDRVTSCSDEATGPYSLEVSFIVPQDSDADLLLRVVVAEPLPRYLELAAP